MGWDEGLPVPMSKERRAQMKTYEDADDNCHGDRNLQVLPVHRAELRLPRTLLTGLVITSPRPAALGPIEQWRLHHDTLVPSRQHQSHITLLSGSRSLSPLSTLNDTLTGGRIRTKTSDLCTKSHSSYHVSARTPWSDSYSRCSADTADRGSCTCPRRTTGPGPNRHTSRRRVCAGPLDTKTSCRCTFRHSRIARPRPDGRRCRMRRKSTGLYSRPSWRGRILRQNGIYRLIMSVCYRVWA